MKRHWLRIAGIVIAVLVLVLIALPFMINVDSFRPRIQSEASAALGRQITLGKLSLSILSSSVRADDIAIADDPAFSTSPFVKAESLKVGVELMPLIFSKKINVTEIVLEKPQITLIKGTNGKWNFSSLGAAGRSNAEAPKASDSPPAVSVGKLNVNHGKLMVAKVHSSAQPEVYDDVNVAVTDFSETSQFPFKLTANLPGGGDADISGKAGPINAENTAKTPFEAAVKVNNMNIADSGFIDRASGIGGLANFDGTLTSDGSTAKAEGTFVGDKLKFSPKGSPAARRVVIKHVVNVDLDKETATITQGDISMGRALAHLTGTAQVQGETQVVNLKLNAPGMPVEEVEAMLPALGIVLPSGSQLSGGTLSTNLAITGPLSNLVVTGPVRLENTTLKNFDLGSKLGALSTFAGKAVSKPDTSIRNFSLDARATQQLIQADNINLDVPAIGVITGAGTVTEPAGALNFKMKANLSGGMVGGITKVAGVASGSTNGIPFAIQGTTSNPHFIPDVGALGNAAAGAVQNAISGKVPGGVPSSATNALGGLLGSKQKKQPH
jgi:AsmA protein